MRGCGLFLGKRAVQLRAATANYLEMPGNRTCLTNEYSGVRFPANRSSSGAKWAGDDISHFVIVACPVNRRHVP